jgi:hypothetical protein
MAASDEECVTFKDANDFFSIEAEGKDPYELDFSGTFQRMQSHLNKTTEDAATPAREVDEGSPVTDSGIHTMLSSQFGPAIQTFYSVHEKVHKELIKTTVGMLTSFELKKMLLRIYINNRYYLIII